MFYFLHKISGINILYYITVRAAIAFFLAFFLTTYLIPKFIKAAKLKKAEQPIYDYAPQNHKSKSNTPTMGGLIFVITTIIASLLCANLENHYVLLSLFCIASFSLIGFFDDWGKIRGKKNEAGMSAKTKFRLQVFFSFLVGASLFFIMKLNSDFYLPFCKYPLFSMSYFAPFFWTMILVSSSNAVNLTDGLDGLATVPSIFSIATLGIFVYVLGNANLSAYLLFPNIQSIGEVIIVATAFIGALLGFLWFNCYPAEIFMGDSGSLSLGAFIGFLAIISKNELLLIIIGFVFVIETLSVILQVSSFKFFKKRIFLMAPIHHHFEIKGWVENKIIVRFWMIALISNLIALTSLKIR